ncbi:MAG: type II toxin-antitoxin system RelE/ParE family toxin [Actinomycetales bacterium]
MQAAWGADVAKALARRLKDMEAAIDPDELLILPGRWEWLKGDLTGKMSARLSANWRLICEPQDDRMLVVSVVDYH